ncbi:MAG: hypothetical protein LBF58_09450 [Deltaproteobacteria bacterium]|nr:hypothetical protein [Deltaproteobacteria bacterium]
MRAGVRVTTMTMKMGQRATMTMKMGQRTTGSMKMGQRTTGSMEVAMTALASERGVINPAIYPVQKNDNPNGQR